MGWRCCSQFSSLSQGSKWILFIFHFLLNPTDHFCSLGLVSLPPQTSFMMALRLCCSKGFWASKIICSVLGKFWTCSDLSEALSPGTTQLCPGGYSGCYTKERPLADKCDLYVSCRLPCVLPRPCSLLSLPLLWRKPWFMFALTSGVAGMCLCDPSSPAHY